MENIEVIRSFVAAWSRLDASELAGYFTESGAYHNMPMQPIVGKENVEEFIKNFIAPWTETQWEIISIVSQGDTVFCERLDKTKSSAGDVDLPCCGVFEMENGKISVWRDYFDMNTYVNAMS